MVTFELKDDAQREAPAPSASHDDATTERRKPLRCRACTAIATYEDARVDIDGQHEHMRVNPAGYVYRFGCFSDAEGCAVLGEPTEAYTWFDGCRWQYAHCRNCAAHLGWCFTGAQSFFGLLVDRLVSEG